jgi:hypothetical protein
MELERYQRADDSDQCGDSHAPTGKTTDVMYRWASIRRPAADAARAANEGGAEPASGAGNKRAAAPAMEDESARVTPAMARAETSDAEHHGRVQGDRRNEKKRTVQSMVRFTPDEFVAVAERARVCGRPPARYIREVALGAVPKARKATTNAELIRELSAIGNTLQQLRMTPRGVGDAPVAEQCELAFRELLDVIRRIGH